MLSSRTPCLKNPSEPVPSFSSVTVLTKYLLQDLTSGHTHKVLCELVLPHNHLALSKHKDDFEVPESTKPVYHFL